MMLDCPAEPLLRHFLAGQLDQAEQQAVAGHVDACRACQETLLRLGEEEDARLLRGMVGPVAVRAPDEAAVPGFLQGLLQGPSLLTRPEEPGASGSGPDWPALAGYEILAELGRGGMGVVYKARQRSLDRVVALKVVRAGAEADGQERARFRTEAEAVARLHHPHIVHIHEVGAAESLDYFAMEFVEGGSLAGRLDGTPWPAAAAAALVEKLAGAVDAAHRRDVIHRDLKPANILLDSEGEPRVADFGLARRLDIEAGQTRTGVVVGTPSYMPPEQAAADSTAIGPTVDVYALGAILYELLTGRPPFRAETPLDTLLQVRFDEPVSPSRLVPKIPRDLETICLKCLRKDRRERYATARALADDLHAFQDGRPIAARPAGVVERLARWVRRRPAPAAALAAGTVALLALVAFGISLLYQSRLEQETEQARRQRDAADRATSALDREKTEVERQRRRTEEQRRLVQRVLFAADVDRASRAWQEGDVVRARRLLLRQRPEQTGGIDLRGFGYHYLWRQVDAARLTIPAHLNLVGVVAFGSDGKALASGGADGMLKLWDPETGRLLRSFQAHNARFFTAAFSPDGKLLATGSEANDARVWDLTTGKVVHDFGHPNAILGVAFSPDSRLLAAACREGTLHLRDLATGQDLINQPAASRGATGVAFHPDGRHFVTTGGDSVIRIWDCKARKQIRALTMKEHLGHCVAYSPDGKCLVAAGRGGIRLWDCDPTGDYRERKLDFGPGTLHSQNTNTVCFSPDSRLLASGTHYGEVLVWDVQGGPPRFLQKAHSGGVLSVVFGPDGQEVVSAGEDGYVRFWNHRNRQPHDWDLKGHRSIVCRVAFHPGDRRVASAGIDGTIRLWDCDAMQGNVLYAGQPAADYQFRSVALSPEGGRLAWSGMQLGTRRQRQGMIGLRDLDGKGPLHLWQGHEQPVNGLAFSPNGKRLATASEDGAIKVWDSDTRRALLTLRGHEAPVMRVVFSPDGARMASASMDKTARVWDSNTGEQQLTLRGHTYHVMDVAYSPDGQRLATAGYDGVIKLWDAAAGTELLVLEGQSYVSSVTFSPDGRHLASGGNTGVKLWDSVTGQEVLTLRAPGGHVSDVAFSHDGSRLAAGLQIGIVKVWDCGTTLER